MSAQAWNEAERCSNVVVGDHERGGAATPAFLSLQGKFKVGQGDVVRDVKHVRDSMDRFGGF